MGNQLNAIWEWKNRDWNITGVPTSVPNVNLVVVWVADPKGARRSGWIEVPKGLRGLYENWRFFLKKKKLISKPGNRRERDHWGDLGVDGWINIRMAFQEVGCGHMDWIGRAQVRDRWRTLVSAVLNLRVPWNAGDFLASCKPVSCSGRTLHRGVSK